MKFISGNIILQGFIYLYTAMTCNAQLKDSIASPADYSLLPLQYIQLQTSNPTAYADVEREPVNIQVFYNHLSGDYKYISDPQSMNGGKVLAEGFKKVNKLNFYGSFSYDLSRLNGQKWKKVLMVSEKNPFVLGDTVRGNYDNEIFEMKGAIASVVNQKLKWGVSVNYRGGSSANGDDPRPSIDALRYSISPGVMYSFSSGWDIGANLAYEGYAENISLKIVEQTRNFGINMFQGLGNYSPDLGVTLSRKYNGKTFGGDIQLVRKSRQNQNILQLGYKNKEEDSEHGSAFPFKSGDYEEATYSLLNLFSIKKNEISHLVKINADYQNSKGTWYDQNKKITNNGQVSWVIFNQSVKYKDQTLKAGLEYTLLKEREGMKEFTFGGAINMEVSETKFLPEMYLQKYTNMEASLEAGKTFWLPNKFQLGFDVNASYKQNLSSKANFEGIKLADEWSFPVFEYLTSGHYAGAGSFKLSKRTLFGKTPSIVYLTGGVNYMQSTIETNYLDKPTRVGVVTSFGVIF